MFLVRPGMTGHPQADFPDLVYGRAHQPYVSRVLLPATVRIVESVTPQAVKNFAHDQLADRLIVTDFGWYDAYLYEFAVATLLMLFCLIGFAFTLKKLTEVFYDFPPILVNLGPLIGLSLLPLFFRYYSYLYDPGTLLLFPLSILFLAQKRFGWFVFSFILATLNKETSVLLLGLFICHEWVVDRRFRVTRMLVLVLLWVALRAALVWGFKDNPGVLLEHHFREHTVWLLTRFPIALRYFLAVAALFFVFIRHDWRSKPRFLKVGLPTAAVPLLVASMFFGFADELRGYYEVFPFLYLLALPSIYRILGFETSSRKQP